MYFLQRVARASAAHSAKAPERSCATAPRTSATSTTSLSNEFIRWTASCWPPPRWLPFKIMGDSNALPVKTEFTSCSCMDARDAARLQPAEARGSPSPSKLWKTRAQTMIRDEGGGPIVFIRALKMPVWHRAAQIRRPYRFHKGAEDAGLAPRC